MAFDNAVLVQEFPRNYTLDTGTPVEDFDLMGATAFLIHDSLLIVSASRGDGFWSVYSLEDGSVLGRFLRHGNGPDEFRWMPQLYDASVQEDGGEVRIVFYSNTAGKISELNLTESLRDGNAHLRTLYEPLDNQVFSAVWMEGGEVLCRELSRDATRQDRYILTGGGQLVPDALAELNEAQIRHGEDFNLLASIIRYGPKSGRIVEMPIWLSTLNVYALDGSFARSVIVSKKPEGLEAIQKKPRMMRRDTFVSLRLYDGAFGVLYPDASGVIAGAGRKKPQVLLFDWDGNPLARIELPDAADSFDIDFRNGCLYTFDRENEVLRRYDFDDVLKDLNGL